MNQENKQSVLLRISGNLLELSEGPFEALPKNIVEILANHLVYTYKPYRPPSLDPIHGSKNFSIGFEEKRLYYVDRHGRLICGAGLLSKVLKVLSGASIPVKVIDCSPPEYRQNRKAYTPDYRSLGKAFTFRDKQSDCLAAIAAHRCGIIWAPTGFGKGVLIAMLCRLYPKATFHVVTEGQDLVERMVRNIMAYVPSVGQVGCGKRTLGRVTVFSADSLHLSDGKADFLLADEGHLLATPSRAEPLSRYRYSRNFMFDATPKGRIDGADAKLESVFGPVIFHLSYQEAQELGLVTPIQVDWIHGDFPSNPCESKKSLVIRKRWGIWRHKARNEAIADKILSYPDDTQILVIVETIEHALFLRQLLPDFQLCCGEVDLDDARFKAFQKQGLWGKNEKSISPKQREEMRRAFEAGKLRKVIATGIWSTGVDFVNLQVLVRADGLNSAIQDSQVPGRVCRIRDGKEVGIVVDSLDQFDEGFRRRAKQRMANYKRHGWKMNFPTLSKT